MAQPSEDGGRRKSIGLRERLDAVPTDGVHAGKGDAVSMKAQVIFDACWKKMEAKLKDVSSSSLSSDVYRCIQL